MHLDFCLYSAFKENNSKKVNGRAITVDLIRFCNKNFNICDLEIAYSATEMYRKISFKTHVSRRFVFQEVNYVFVFKLPEVAGRNSL